uniref:Reverse transcriptase domain-containing protein n=1 Tax=Tanacetum cinerariifolium TaxID=118510 RepID=A0A6L2N170_TANCI|nr:reverse transcriptase domain-containing protein [Tanacetum cinerariifolium]
MFQQTLDGKARAWFDKIPPGSIDNWGDLQEKFLNRFRMLKACDKDPMEISKIVRKANETLPNFKERWVSESNVIPNVLELMQISSFMSTHKCPELAKCLLDSIPKMVGEMLKRVDDYLRSKEAFWNTELPKGEFQRKDPSVQWMHRNDRSQHFPYENHRRRSEHKLVFRAHEYHTQYVPPQHPNQEFRRPRENRAVLTLDSLSSTPQEIFATKHQLRLPQPTPLLEQALESGKLNHLIKDVRQRGRAGQQNNGPQKAKVINMVQCLDWKRKTIITDEKWMNIPITFPLVLARDLSEESLVVEAKVEGYLVRRIHIDEGALVEIMGSGLCWRVIMKFTIILEPSPYNIILGRSNLKQLRAILSTIHGMMKFPTPWGIATLVSQAAIIFECMREGKKQAVDRPKETKLQEKDYYPFLEIDSKIESVVGFLLKCFLDAYKGYDQVQMAEEDEEKTAFYTDQGTYCYTKIPFGLKNAVATYQRLVDEAFRSQIRRKLKVYVDDMVVKSKFERELLADIAETFDNLRRINMKLNLKKCSFGVKEGKFLGYMVTLKGIRDNPVKTKDIAKMQSPKTWGDTQSVAGKLAALNRFLSRSAKKSLPFFETLKYITKANKHDYRWTKKAEDAFQELKKMILDLPILTTPLPKETLFVYLGTSKEAVSAVLLLVRKGKQRPMHYVRRTLHDAERHYAPLEKITLALRYVSRRLRRYFEAHPITVIMDQPIKQIPNKADTSGKLAQYSVKLGAYNITYDPHSAIKGQKDCKEEWILYTYGASSVKGSGAGLVLINPTKTEYTYSLRLNFESTNNQVEYEALLAGLQIAKKIRAKEYISCFKNFKNQNIPQNKIQKADVLRKLASVAFNHLTKEVLVETLDVPSMYVEDVNAIFEEKGETWMTPIVNCLERGPCSKGTIGQRCTGKQEKKYIMGNGCARTPLESPRKVKFIIVAIDYFTKWIEAKLLAKTTGKEVKKIVWDNIVCRNGETLYNLTFESEAVISIEIGMPTHRTMMIKEGEANEEEIRLNLDLLKERREAAAVQEARYKVKMEQYYNKRVRPVSFKVGEYVYRKNEASRVESLGKLGPK